jgi:DNA polymerase-3 subunit chi
MVGSDADGVEKRDLLINLTDEIPSFAEGFPRVAELVTSDENCRQLSRKRYATYRDQGHELNTHNL